jgi:hypothetical protein
LPAKELAFVKLKANVSAEPIDDARTMKIVVFEMTHLVGGSSLQGNVDHGTHPTRVSFLTHFAGVAEEITVDNHRVDLRE